MELTCCLLRPCERAGGMRDSRNLEGSKEMLVVENEDNPEARRLTPSRLLIAIWDVARIPSKLRHVLSSFGGFDVRYAGKLFAS